MTDAKDSARGVHWAYLVALIALTAIPLAALLLQAFAFRWDWPDLLPSRWWLDARETARLPIGWDYVFSIHSRLFEAATNTIIIAIGATILSLALCWPAARVLAARDFPGKVIVELAFSAPLFVPETAIAIALLALFLTLDLGGNYLTVIVGHVLVQVPYVLRTLVATFQRHGRASEEQAFLLGASRRQVFFEITLPLVAPGIAAASLFAFLVSSSVFSLTFFLGQGQIVTLPTILFSKLMSGTLDPSAAGLAIMAAIPGIVMLMVFGRFLTPLGRHEASTKAKG